MRIASGLLGSFSVISESRVGPLVTDDTCGAADGSAPWRRGQSVLPEPGWMLPSVPEGAFGSPGFGS